MKHLIRKTAVLFLSITSLIVAATSAAPVLAQKTPGLGDLSDQLKPDPKFKVPGLDSKIRVTWYVVEVSCRRDRGYREWWVIFQTRDPVAANRFATDYQASHPGCATRVRSR